VVGGDNFNFINILKDLTCRRDNGIRVALVVCKYSDSPERSVVVRILFATDGSPEADKAKEFLGFFPLPSGSELIIISVVSEESRGEEAKDKPPEELDVAQEAADRAAYHLAKAGISTECLVTCGHPADVICRVAEEKNVELVVVGSRGRSSLARFFLGSISQRVAKHAPASVLVVKPPTKSVERILIGVDGSEDSRKAAEFLKRFPFPPSATVYVAHVVHVLSPSFGEHKGYYETAELGGELEQLRKAAEVDGKKILEGAAESLKGAFKVEKLVSAGPPARRLLELVDEMDADILVVGSRGLTGVERFLMGSVSLQSCHHAHCSVLVVRE
jgi:nucleotide-binding universal stress UspA family protein